MSILLVVFTVGMLLSCMTMLGGSLRACAHEGPRSVLSRRIFRASLILCAVSALGFHVVNTLAHA